MAKGYRRQSKLLRLAHECHPKKGSDESIYPQDLPALTVPTSREEADF